MYQFFSGTSYISWLGATWFLVVLFFVIIIQKLLYSLFPKELNYYYPIISFLLFLLGYYIITNHVGNYKYLDLVLIAQFYFFVGNFFKHINLIGKSLNNAKLNLH